MNNYFFLVSGRGTIQAGVSQQTRLDELTERLQGPEFYVSTEQLIPSKCIDGRAGGEGVAPNTAGGTESIMVADDLTSKHFAATTTLESYANLINELQEVGHPIGGHTDVHARDAASGCGANDKLELIYGFIAESGDILRTLAADLGVQVNDKTHALITANAAARTEFSPGSELLTVLRTAGGEVDELVGEHKEVIAVINTVEGSTLSRELLAAEFGQDYEAFNVDVWSFKEAAATIAQDEAEIPALMAALVYYNLATAHILCGPNMRVIVRS